MKQVFISGKGEPVIFDVPAPIRSIGWVLVKNAFSLISSGTEGASVSRRGGWIGAIEMALESRERMQRVWHLSRSLGMVATWDAVKGKLNDYLVTGYSSAGMIIEASEAEMPIHAGNLVACMGGGIATHSEYVAVPTNLLAPIPDGVPLEQAAFGALGCIAIQGIRRLELQPGDWIGVLGLGLIGQITLQLLIAMGYRAIGIDLVSERSQKARELSGVDTWSQDEADSIYRVRELTNGRGVDGMIVCAAAKSDEPINLAFDLCRKRGRVSLVGDVGLKLARAKMYEKEIEVRVSCSYGPGRYDDEYELRGKDYPYHYVRWTENRNLEFFLDLLKQKRLNLEPLITLRCPIDEAPSAYARVKSGEPGTYGVIFDYGPLPEKPPEATQDLFSVHLVPGPNFAYRKAKNEVIGLGIIGAGAFMRTVQIPNLVHLSDLYHIVGIASRTGSTAGIMARKANIPFATSDYRLLLQDPSVDAMLIATRHTTHAQLVLDSLAAGKHVFVEKPMCLTIEDGEEICRQAEARGLVVRVGFNRRFAPYLNVLRRSVGLRGYRILCCRVNIGMIGSDWSNTVAEGGRFMGEAVHFLDLCNWFMDQEPKKIAASFAGNRSITNPNAIVQIEYDNGCVAQVVYTGLGNSAAGKEYFEAFGNGCTATCNDYKSVNAFGRNIATGKEGRYDKGHLAELKEFAATIKGKEYPVKGADSVAGLLATSMVLSLYADNS